MGNTIKVLHVGLSSNIGGIETVVRMWNRYKESDFVFDFINNDTGKLAFEDEFRASGSRIYKIPSRKSDFRRSYAALDKILKEHNYDYLHFHAMSLSWPEPILIAAKGKRTQPIIHSHMVVDKYMSLKYRMLHTIGKMRLHNVDFSELACGFNAGQSMFTNQNFTIIPNGIELESFYFSENQRIRVRRELGIENNIYVIGHVGRSGPQKNYPFIFKTISELIKAGEDNIRLLLIGDIKDDSEIKKLEMEYSLTPYIIYAGYVRDPSSYYSAMDIFFFPSLYEGFSVSLIEAQTANLPCIVSNNVALESKLTDRFEFIDIKDTAAAKESIKKYSKMNFDRTKNPDIEYDIRKTSKKMFEYYRAHITDER